MKRTSSAPDDDAGQGLRPTRRRLLNAARVAKLSALPHLPACEGGNHGHACEYGLRCTFIGDAVSHGREGRSL